MSIPFRDVYCQSADGLKIHGRMLEPAKTAGLPVLCLPGLTRTAEDFDVIAQALANAPGAPRKVLAIEYRGRGLSDSDPNPANYNIVTEMGDVLAMAASLSIARAIFLGTSRGGMISMLMAATKPDMLAGVILNDVGPALSMAGLMKIRGYISNPPQRHTWKEAADGLKSLFGTAFPAMDDAGWMDWARRAFRKTADGGLERTYDPNLSATFAGLDPTKPPKPLWDLFDKLPADKPLMLIHGLLSDLLLPEAVRDMTARRPDIELVQVPQEGHAPLLADQPTVARILAFCGRCDRVETDVG